MAQQQDDPLDNLTHEQRAALAELAAARVDGRVSRREALGTLGALGVGSLLGGGGALAATQDAQAQASTSNQYGNAGTPNDRVDVFAQGVDVEGETVTQSLSTVEEQIVTGFDGTDKSITYASQNDSKYPDVDAAISNADDNDTVVILPGEHQCNPVVDNNITLVFYGWIDGQSNGPGLVVNEPAHFEMRRSYRNDDIPIAVYRGDPGIEWHAKCTSNAPILALFAQGIGNGGHGHYFHIDSSGQNLNWGGLQVGARECSGDGVRFEQTGGSSNLNAQRTEVVVSNANSGAGVRILGGWSNDIVVRNTEGCQRGVVIGTNSQIGNRVTVLNSEGHTSGEDVVVQSQAENIDLITNNSLTVIDERQDRATQRFGEAPTTVADIRRNYADMEFFLDSGLPVDESVSGSGSISASGRSLTLDTGSTSGSSAQARKIVQTQTAFEGLDKKRAFAASIELLDNADSRTDYIATGYKGSNGFGYKIENSDLKGFVTVGGTETTTSAIISNISTGIHELVAEFKPNDRIEYFANGNRAEQSTSLYNSGFGNIAFELYCENTSGVQRRLRSSRFRVGTF